MEELSLHILDIAENSVAAGATLVEIGVKYQLGKAPWLTITVRDNGRGMSPEVASRVSDPFYTTRTTRKVGLGTALFRQTAELAGGELPGVVRAGQGHRGDRSHGRRFLCCPGAGRRAVCARGLQGQGR